MYFYSPHWVHDNILSCTGQGSDTISLARMFLMETCMLLAKVRVQELRDPITSNRLRVWFRKRTFFTYQVQIILNLIIPTKRAFRFFSNFCYSKFCPSDRDVTSGALVISPFCSRQNLKVLFAVNSLCSLNWYKKIGRWKEIFQGLPSFRFLSRDTSYSAKRQCLKRMFF